MNVQFNCPYCQQLMSADARLTGGQVQCAACQQVFVLGASAPALPVAQPHSAAPLQAQRPAPGQRPPQQRPHAPPRKAPKADTQKEEAKAKVAIVAMLGGGVALIVGAIWLISFLSSKAEQQQNALPAEVVQREQAAKAQREKEQTEAQGRVKKSQEEWRKFFATYLCDGDQKVARELVGMIEAIDAEHEKLTRDADTNNDPKDLRQFWKERIAFHTQANIVLRNWLGGRSSAPIVAVLFGEEPERERGKTPDFMQGGNYSGNGTGFCISADGWIVTNAHVVGDEPQVDVRGADGKVVSAKVMNSDTRADLALIKISARPAAWLSIDPAPMQMGGNVFTIGFPNATVQGVEPKFTDGRISSLTGIRDDEDTYQTSVPVGPGNSGGALVDLKSGAVTGVIAAKLNSSLRADSVSYAIKSKVLDTFLKTAADAQAAATGSAPPSANGESDLIARVRAATYLILVK
ncbi:MAG: trypsin-like peptidase domain-containing protein [Verrucomicrobiaceae bacterium]|nr:trypsin-like peptidase domain-containing protein [Verrucomicrobiaceae bacterium]